MSRLRFHDPIPGGRRPESGSYHYREPAPIDPWTGLAVVAPTPAFQRAVLRTAAFVARAHLDILGRAVDRETLVRLRDLVLNDLSFPRMAHHAVAAHLLVSGEYKVKVVQESHRRFLGRPADPAGLLEHARALGRSASIEEVHALLIGSDEYLKNRGGGCEAGLVQAMHWDALGRPSDRFEFELAHELLAAGVARRDLAHRLLLTPGAIQRRVQEHYRKFLRRPAEPAELTATVDAIRDGASDEAVLAGLVGSAHYDASQDDVDAFLQEEGELAFVLTLP